MIAVFSILAQVITEPEKEVQKANQSVVGGRDGPGMRYSCTLSSEFVKYSCQHGAAEAAQQCLRNSHECTNLFCACLPCLQQNSFMANFVGVLKQLKLNNTES